MPSHYARADDGDDTRRAAPWARSARARRALLAQSVEIGRELIELLLAQRFQLDEPVARAAIGANELVELEVKRLGVAVLRVLDEKDHQERDDGRRRVDDELPGVREVEQGAARYPHDDRP